MKRAEHPRAELPALLRRGPLFEIYLSYKFIWRDLTTTVVPSLIFIFTALKTNPPVTREDITRALFWGALYFWLYIYSFCLGDQLAGVEEDRINKPDRPLPSGLVTYRGAFVRWIIAMALFLAVGFWLGVLKWALLWVFVSVMHNFGGWDKHWFTKNCVAMPLGNLAELAAAWELVRPLTLTGARWLLLSPVFTLLTMSVQDFRDVKGDRIIGRRTLPMVLGEEASRRAIAFSLLVALAVIHCALLPAERSVSLVLCELVIATLDIIIVARLLRLRSPEADHKTYMLYTYWYCFILTSGLIAL